MDIIKHKNKSLAIIIVVLFFIIAIAGITIYNQNTLEQTKDTYTLEAGKELELHASDFFNVDKRKAAQITFDTSAVDVNTAGEYTAVANFKGKAFEIKVTVVDTTAPKVTFLNRYIITNDIVSPDYSNTFEGVYDASEWSAKLVRFEFKRNLSEMDEKALKELTDTIPVPCDAEELNAIGTTDIPTEEGIYRAVLEVADTHGNTSLEEVYVIYDTTGARIEDTPDKTVYVAKGDLDKEPEIDKTDYSITDNVDGTVSSDDISCELELRDADKHEWLVHVSYIDRAGNESKADFLIIVKEDTDKKDTVENQNNSSDDNGENDADNQSANNNTNDSADADGDGVITDEEAANNISPSEQKVIDAGYGVVVQLDATTYAVLTPGDGFVNGQEGNLYLREYLLSMGLAPTNGVSGCWIDSDNDWYWYIAYDVHEVDTSGNEW